MLLQLCCYFIILIYTDLTHFYRRKEKFSLSDTNLIEVFTPRILRSIKLEEAFFHTSLRGSLTVEAAVVMPVFFLCMTLILQLGNVYHGAARYSCALNQTAQEMAIAAYARDGDKEKTLPEAAVSLAYAQVRVTGLAGENSAIRHPNMLLSSVMEEDDRIRLILTYQVNSPFGIVKMPGTVFVQEASARAWTGRKGSSGKADSGDGKDQRIVYVTENGRVYHVDPECTHIHLSIQIAEKSSLKTRRNLYGAKYHSCEHCGKNAGNLVYITTDGNRYHSSLDCSGLKRTIHEMTMDEIGEMRPCSKCGKKEIKK